MRLKRSSWCDGIGLHFHLHYYSPLIFLLSAIIKTTRNTSMGMWKTSAMPTLIYILAKEAQTKFNDPAVWHTGDGVSKKYTNKAVG